MWESLAPPAGRGSQSGGSRTPRPRLAHQVAAVSRGAPLKKTDPGPRSGCFACDVFDVTFSNPCRRFEKDRQRIAKRPLRGHRGHHWMSDRSNGVYGASSWDPRLRQNGRLLEALLSVAFLKYRRLSNDQTILRESWTSSPRSCASLCCPRFWQVRRQQKRHHHL